MDQATKFKDFTSSKQESMTIGIQAHIKSAALVVPRSGMYGDQYSCILISKNPLLKEFLQPVDKETDQYWYNQNATFPDGNIAKPVPVEYLPDTEQEPTSPEIPDGSEVQLMLEVTKYKAGKSKSSGKKFDAGMNAQATYIRVIKTPETLASQMDTIFDESNITGDDFPF